MSKKSRGLVRSPSGRTAPMTGIVKGWNNPVRVFKTVGGLTREVQVRVGKSGQSLFFNQKTRRWERYRGHNFRHYAVVL